MTIENSLVARPKVLILLATYNGGLWLKEQLNSVLAQEAVDIRIVVGDDRSSDDTLQVIAEFANDGRIENWVWPLPSGSAGANFRRLIRSANSDGFDFVAFCDQDDIWHQKKIIEAINCLNISGCAGYSCAVRSFWPNGQVKLISQTPDLRSADHFFEGAGQGCTFVLTSKFFTSVRNFVLANEPAVEALHYHDWLVYLLSRIWGLTWYFDTRSWIDYRQHGGNEIGSRGGKGAIRARVAKIKNGWYSTQVRAAVLLAMLAGDDSAATKKLHALLNSAALTVRPVRMGFFILKHSRRKLPDRWFLSICAFLGIFR